MTGTVNWVYHVRAGDGWSGRLSYEQVVEQLPAKTDAEWERLEALESTIGRAHEASTP